MMKCRSKGVLGDQWIRVISVNHEPQIDAFSLRSCARPEIGGKKGASAESKNSDILKENIDT